MIRRIDPGQRYSEAVIHKGFVWLCGQVGEGRDVTEQTRDCLANIDALLEKTGSSRSHILQATIGFANSLAYRYIFA